MLRIGVISDVHGGGVALDAALADLRKQGVDRIVALGDMLQGGSEPARVAERLAELACPVVMGNSDWFVLTGEAPHPVSDAAREVREWTRAQLGDEGLALAASFEPTVSVELEDGTSMLGFHGSPRDRDEVLLPETTDQEWAAAIDGDRAAVLAGGHVTCNGSGGSAGRCSSIRAASASPTTATTSRRSTGSTRSRSTRC